MGTQFIVGGDARSQLGSWRAAPSEDGLKGVFFLGQSLASSVVNRAKGASGNAAVFGAPAVNAYSMNLHTGVDYLELPILDTPRMTAIIVGRAIGTPTADAATRPVFLGTTESGNRGFNVYVGTPAPGQQLGVNAYRELIADGSSLGASNAGNAVADINRMRCMIAYSNVDSGGQFTVLGLADMTGTGGGSGADLVQNTIDTGFKRVAGAPLRIGGGPSSFGGMSEICMVAIYDRMVAADERAAWYATLLSLYAGWGVSI